MKLSLYRYTSDSLSDQIYHQIADRIHSNILKSGEQLPSIRSFSKTTSVSLLTVQKAYKKLEKTGLVKMVHGKGVFVRSTEKKEQDESEFNWQLSIPNYLSRSSFTSRTITTYAFDYSALHSGLLPTMYLAKELKDILDLQPSIIGTYGNVQGDDLTRDAFSTYFQKQMGISSSREDIIITTGLHQGVDLIAKALVRSGDIVFTESPTYPGALDIFINHGAKVIPIPMDEQGMRMDLLSEAARKFKPKAIYVNPTFQNPTGRSMSTKRRKELLEQAKNHGAFIIEDDSWSELYFEEKKPPKSIKTFDVEGRVIFLKGFSKALAPGIRIGAIYANGPIKQALLIAKSTTDLGTPLLTQRAVLPFLNSTRMLEHFEKLRLALELRRDKVISLLKNAFPSLITFQVPEGGLNLWMTFPDSISTVDFYEYCLKHDLSFLPGHLCYPYEPPYHHLRLTYANMSEKQLEEGIQRFILLTKKYFIEQGIDPHN